MNETPDPEPRHVCEMAQGALADLVQQLDPGAMVTRFVALVEVDDSEGERGVWSLTAPEASTWDTAGLLQYGLMVEQAAQACTHE